MIALGVGAARLAEPSDQLAFSDDFSSLETLNN